MTTAVATAAFPQTPLQAGMLFHSRLAPGGGFYVQQMLVGLPEVVDTDALRAAWEFTASRHDVLHTAFPAEDAGVQRVEDDVLLPWAEQDWTRLRPDEQARRLDEFLTSDRERGFDLPTAPLTRLTLVRRGPADFLLVWTFHHALLDGRSHRRVLEEAFDAYEAFRTGAYPSMVPPRPFRAHLEWLAEQDEAAAEGYWRERLRGFRAPTPLPLPRPGVGFAAVEGGTAPSPPSPLPQSRERGERQETLLAALRARGALSSPLSRLCGRGDGGEGSSSPALWGDLTARLPADATAALHAAATAHGLTTHALLQAAWAVLLARYSGEADVVFGSTRSGRRPGVKDVDTTVGLLINTVPVRFRVDPARPLLDWLRDVRADAVALRPFDHAAPVDVQAYSEVPAGTPLYDTILVFEGYRLQDALRARGGDWARRTVALRERPHYPITLAAYDGAELELKLYYDPERFDADTAGRMVGHLTTLLNELPTHLTRPVADWPMLPTAERQQALAEWNDTAAPYPRDRCLHEFFEEQARRAPDASAVLHDGTAWSYRELDERANRLARHLQGLGVGRGDLVGVCMNRSAEMVVAVLGILKAGAAYAPFDPAYPKERLAFLLADTAARALVTQVRRLEQLPATDVPIVRIDADWPVIERHEPTAPPRASTADDVAYVIYTSGSTGTPKGVVLRHRGVANTLDWVNRTFAVGPGDTLLWVTSICFDLSVYDLFGVLGAGGTVRVATGSELRDPERLLRVLCEEHITIWDSAPSLLAQLAPHFPPPADRPLRLVLLSGDWIPVALPDQVRAAFPQARVVSLGGATEAAIWSNWYPVGRVDPNWPSIPYGLPIQNFRYYILDAHGQPAPVGVPAELFIAGDGLADGYLNRPELTAERFLPDPFSAGGRMYRTGDLVRRLPDGNIEFLGRRDHQVKVRGFRIELGEVEAALLRHPDVARSVAAVRPDATGEKRLIAYVVPRAGTAPTTSELRRFLLDTLPEYLVPAQFVPLEALPLSANGKVDRAALPDPGRPVACPVGAVLPRDDVEQALADVWCEVLGLECVGVTDSFFELGGHSLKAAQVVGRVRQRLGRELPLAEFFKTPTIAALRHALTDASVPTERGCASPRVAPAAPAQRQFWFLHQLGQGTDVYTIACTVRLDGETDVAAVRAALAGLAERHDALRTTFTDAAGRLEQVIAPPGPVPLPLTDLSRLPDADAEAARLADEDARAGFDLRRGPLWRARLLCVGARDHRLLLTLHHLVVDGESLRVLLAELAALYVAGRDGRPAELPPAPSFAGCCRRAEAELPARLPELLAYWTERLTPPPPPLELPGVGLRPAAPSFRGAMTQVEFPPGTAEAVAALARRAGTTPFVVLLAAFHATLGRLTDQDDLAVGAPAAGRGAAGTDGLVGPLVNTLVLRADLSGEPTFAELVARTRDVVQGALAHQDLPFDVLVRELRPQRDAGLPPLFQVMFCYGPVLPALTVPGTAWTPMLVPTGTAKFDLSLFLDEAPDGLLGAIEYSTDLFDAAAVERLAGHFRTLLAAALADPSAPIAGLPLTTAGEQAEVRAAAAGPVLAIDDVCLPQLVERQAARVPDRPAVRHAGRTLTYAELNARANRLAHRLRELGVGPDVPVGLMLERTPTLIAAALAILKAGGAYLPLDPAHPPDRLAAMLDDAGAAVLVAGAASAALLATGRWTVLDPDCPAVTRGPATDPPPAAGRDHLAYIIYTSGSTGVPKGVAVTHAGLASLLPAMAQALGVTADDRCLAVGTVAFDIHVGEIWLPLALGGAVELVGRDVAADGPRLAQLMGEARPTVAQLTPAGWQILLAAGWEGDPALTAVSAGEALPPELAAQLLPRCRALWNGYGPTEATVYSTFHRVRPGDSPVPIGRPLANTTARVLDRRQRPVPVGVAGELCVGGAQLARGYLNRPELTAERFVEVSDDGDTVRLYRTGDRCRLRADGAIEYLGRLDRQVKVRGFRIELGEVEAALLRHPGVRQAAAAARAGTLAAYVVPHAGVFPTAAELKQFLRAALPDYMVPAQIVFLEALPLTPTGKVDRDALPAPEPASERDRPLVGPRNDAERDLAAVWEEVLKVSPIGVTDDFFELGGHSLLAAVLMARIRERLGHPLPLGALFAAPTVEKLAAVLQHDLEAGTASCLVPLQEGGTLPPLFLIAGVGGHVFTFHKFARLLGPEQPSYGLKAIGVDGTEPPLDRVEAIAARYEAEIVRRRPTGPVVLGGYSIGGLIAYELALRLRAAGRPVDRLVLFDVTAPGYPRPLPLPRRLWVHLRNAVRELASGRAGYVRQRAANVWSRLLDRLGLTVLNAPTIAGVAALPQDALKRVWAALRVARNHYWPRARFDGPVLLVKAAEPYEWAATVLDDPLMGWGRWAPGGVETVTVPGRHLDLFREDNLPLLAEALRR